MTADGPQQGRIVPGLQLAYDAVFLALVAVVILVPELLRLLACKTTGRQYQPPSVRIAQESEAKTDE
mgnify:CR=1 FL=1